MRSFDRLPPLRRVLLLCLVLGFDAPGRAQAKDAEVVLRQEAGQTLIQFLGDNDDDWYLQTSPDLVTWTHHTPFGVLHSGRGSNSVSRAITDLPEGSRFFRALKTDGLYDSNLLRTLSLTFTQANWQSLLTANYSRGSNITAAQCVLDNGSTNRNVGVRYKGNTSYTMSGAKKSLNIELDWTEPGGDLMGYKTLNLNNAAGDESILREPIYFGVLQNYAPGPKGSLVKLNINGAYWGVYSFAQQENSDLIKEWFPSADGDRWRTPNAAGGGGGGGGGLPGPGGGGGGGGAFSSPVSALSWQGADVARYKSYYTLKTDNSTNAWERLVHAIDVLNNTPAARLGDEVDNVLAVDSWLWFLAAECVFADDDSYFNKGADYGFYYELESGRIFPLEHDGNEAFVAGDVNLSPVIGTSGTNRPVIKQLLSVPDFRQRYLAHMRTILAEFFNPTVMNGIIDAYVALSRDAITADTKKNYTMSAYNSDLTALKNFVRNRNAYLTNHAELSPRPPTLASAQSPSPAPTAAVSPFLTVVAHPDGTNGIDSVRLYHRTKSYGRFTPVLMFDDGNHGDGAAGDHVFGAQVPPYPAGTKVRYYFEARSANPAKAAAFLPARAETKTLDYRVLAVTAPDSPVIISELMPSNSSAMPDPQGEFDDWIELHNLTDQPVDLTGRYLSDEPNNPRKWPFPSGTIIPANGYLIVWADEDGSAPSGLHASFKLDAEGEALFLTDTDANLNAILDTVTFPSVATDRSWARSAADADQWVESAPSAGQPNP